MNSTLDFPFLLTSSAEHILLFLVRKKYVKQSQKVTNGKYKQTLPCNTSFLMLLRSSPAAYRIIFAVQCLCKYNLTRCKDGIACDVIELQLFSIDHLKVGKVVSRCFVPTIHPCTMFVTKLDQDLISVPLIYCISLDVICTQKKYSCYVSSFHYITD